MIEEMISYIPDNSLILKEYKKVIPTSGFKPRPVKHQQPNRKSEKTNKRQKIAKSQ